MVVLEMLPPLFLWGPLPRRICAACQQSRVNVPQNCREVQCQLLNVQHFVLLLVDLLEAHADFMVAWPWESKGRIGGIRIHHALADEWHGP